MLNKCLGEEASKKVSIQVTKGTLRKQSHPKGNQWYQ